MEVIILPTADEASEVAARLVARQIREKPTSAIGQAMGDALPICLFLAMQLLSSQAADLSSATAGAALPLIPQPAKVEVATGTFSITPKTPIVTDPASAGAGRLLAEALAPATGFLLDVTARPESDVPFIALNEDADLSSLGLEGYRLAVTPQAIRISSAGQAGLFYGLQTLRQLLPAQVFSPSRAQGVEWTVPCVTVEDSPRFGWRGLMLDSARHFFTVPEVCRFIDQMALHKFNVFHWHLTDDQGWRVEVKAYPKLTSIGAWRPESAKMGDKSTGDGQPYGGFYTQDDLRKVVAYAASRHITVVPEIEMPGHSSAAIRAYPELGNDDIPGWKPPEGNATWCWGVRPYTLAPKEETFRFIKAVLDEILPIFPGPYAHIGGDEAPKAQWKQSPFAQRFIADNNLGDEHGLQSYFIRRVEKLLADQGKRLIGWDEIQEGGLSPTATMMVWRDLKWAKLALDRGNDVVMAPCKNTYLDYSPGEMPATPESETFHIPSASPTLTLADIYRFDPVPDGTAPARLAQVLGCQGQIWAEYIWSLPKIEYMAWPRSCALAEVAWSPAKDKNYDSFTRRLTTHLTRLDHLQVNYRRADGSPAQPSQSMARQPHP